MKRKKYKISINNKLKDCLGQINLNRKGKVEGKKKKLKIEINVKAHKGDKKELASTIKHELMHAKYPKMTEKNVYKKSQKSKLKPKEISRLLKKIK